MLKELNEIRKMIQVENENINQEIEIIKMNQIQIIELKNMITEGFIRQNKQTMRPVQAPSTRPVFVYIMGISQVEKRKGQKEYLNK